MWRASLFVLVVSFCAPAHAEATCPWLTQGTAATLLGGDVSVIVHVIEGMGSCDFVSNTNGGTKASPSRASLHLRIQVSHSSSKECATGERLTGIGEDAVLCSQTAAGDQQDIVRGRVRSTYFLCVLEGAKTNSTDDAFQRTTIERIAEVVAGNLF
jgi:hypothetical protein